jgi:hypothetical protein
MMITEARGELWGEWQASVVAVIRADFSDVLSELGAEDVDWDAWRPLYEQGCTPQLAVDRAFVRM